MAISEAFAGTVTIGTTEFSLPNNTTTLTPQTSANVYQVLIDLSALTSAESYKLQIKEKVRSSSTQRVIQSVILYGAQTEAVYVSPALTLLNGWDITLTKLTGTDRVIDYSIRKAV